MEADRHLHSISLLDCRGRITHVLEVQPDGRVRVQVGSLVATVDPRTLAVLPRGARLGAGEYGDRAVLDMARRLAAEVGR
jgi:hypothetical protein